MLRNIFVLSHKSNNASNEGINITISRSSFLKEMGLAESKVNKDKVFDYLILLMNFHYENHTKYDNRLEVEYKSFINFKKVVIS